MSGFSWTNPYAWPRKPLLAQNIVSTSQPLAAQAGLGPVELGLGLCEDRSNLRARCLAKRSIEKTRYRQNSCDDRSRSRN